MPYILRVNYATKVDHDCGLVKFSVVLLVTVTFACFQALLQSVPVGRLVVLDLFAEVKPIWITSEQFYGVPYIWQVMSIFLVINDI